MNNTAKKCSDKECPYGLPRYSEHPNYHGLCLNCLDDKEKDDQFMREEYGHNFQCR